MSVAPQLIRRLLDEAAEMAEEWVDDDLTARIRAIRQWANNEAKVSDLSRRFVGGK